MIERDPFQNLVWNALRSVHAKLAVGDMSVLRYPRDIVPFAALADASHSDISPLERLFGKDDLVHLVGAEPTPTETLIVGPEIPCYQMFYPTDSNPPEKTDQTTTIVKLSVEDVPEMITLANFELRGFMEPRTYLLGDFYGIRVGNTLIAMAGERIVLPGYREIATVCTHPNHTGKGYAGLLTNHLVRGHVAAQQQSFLHVRQSNARACALYERLGFVTAREMSFWPVGRSDGTQS